MWWSFSSGLLTGWCICAWTWWQWFDFCDSDSAADSDTSTYCTALTWRSTGLVIMTGLGQGLAIAAYQEQANSMRRSHNENGSIQMNMYSLGVMDLDLSISPDVFGLRAFNADRPVTRMLPGSSPCELRLMLPDAKLGIDGFHDVIIENLAATPALAEGCIQHHTTPGVRCRVSPPRCPEKSGQGVSLQWTGFLWHL